VIKIGAKRFKFKGKRVVSDTGPAPIRAAIDAQGAALALFDQGEQKDITASALAEATEWYMATIIPLFFGPYATKHGYRSAAHRGDSPTGENLPLVHEGWTRQSVIEGMAYEVKKAGLNVSTRISMPLPANKKGVVYGLLDRSQVAIVLRQITPEEVGRVAAKFAKVLAEILANREPTNPPVQPTAPAGRPARAVGQQRKLPARGYTRAMERAGTFSPVRMP
jgi:hypothetical protein